MAERLQAVAIMRDGKLLRARHGGSHFELRGYKDRIEGDVEGFVTDAGRFLTRREAVDVAIAAGQIGSQWRTTKRALLSSDITW